MFEKESKVNIQKRKEALKQIQALLVPKGYDNFGKLRGNAYLTQNRYSFAVFDIVCGSALEKAASQIEYSFAFSPAPSVDSRKVQRFVYSNLPDFFEIKEDNFLAKRLDLNLTDVTSAAEEVDKNYTTVNDALSIIKLRKFRKLEPFF